MIDLACALKPRPPKPFRKMKQDSTLKPTVYATLGALALLFEAAYQ
jgi:hypothetical protein